MRVFDDYYLPSDGLCVITERPQIDMYEKKVVVGSGDTANLHCSAKGIPRPEIHWFKGELEVSSV